MPKITVRVDDKTYRQIRTWCAQRDTCVSHVVQAFLRDLPQLKNVPQFPGPPALETRRSQADIERDAEIERVNLGSVNPADFL
jgi:hypothetical protein